MAEEDATCTILTMWRSGLRKTFWGWSFPSTCWPISLTLLWAVHLSCCVSEPYNGLIETYFVHITAYPILKSPAQDCFKKIWVSRENIKVTLIKGQNHESRHEKKLGMLVPLGEACSRSRTADQGFRQGEQPPDINIFFAHPGAWKKTRAVPIYVQGCAHFVWRTLQVFVWLQWQSFWGTVNTALIL